MSAQQGGGITEVEILSIPMPDRELMAQTIHEGGWDWCANGRSEWRWSKATPREKKIAYAKADAVLKLLWIGASNVAREHAGQTAAASGDQSIAALAAAAINKCGFCGTPGEACPDENNECCCLPCYEAEGGHLLD